MARQTTCKEYKGVKIWYQDGKYHRDDDLPAIEWANGDKYWYQNGQKHRTDGPAVEYTNGHKSWYIDGKEYSFKKWLQLCSLSRERKCELVLIYE